MVKCVILCQLMQNQDQILSLLGEFEATVDSKGRFLLPSGVKKQLPEEATKFVMNRGFEGCLNLYPQQSWKPVIDNINKLNDFDPKVREFKRKFLGGATEVETDSAGRILIPQSLKEYADLVNVKDIVLAANGSKIELWNAAKYKKLFEDFSSEDFSKLANEVMGNNETETKS